MLVYKRLIECYTTVGRVEAIPKDWQHKDHILVKIIAHKVRISSVSLSAMDEKQRFQEPKLTNNKISTSGCLLSFQASYPHSHMSRGNHIHIISTVTNR